MTAVEKAEELVRKYYTFGLNNTAQSFSWYECKQCAKIAVDEIIRAIPDASDDDSPYNHELKFWQEVNRELNKPEEDSVAPGPAHMARMSEAGRYD